MANALYTPFKVLLLNTAGPDLSSAGVTVNAVLVDAADYTVNAAAHDFFDDVPAGARVASGAIGSKTTTGGVFDGADVTWTSVSGDVSEDVVIYQDTAGADGTDPLIAFFDTFASGMSVTPNTGNITCAWHASGIFSL